jgi:hypothetical protein
MYIRVWAENSVKQISVSLVYPVPRMLTYTKMWAVPTPDHNKIQSWALITPLTTRINFLSYLATSFLFTYAECLM